MSTTPLDAWDPYTAAALASLSRSILRMSAGLMEVIAPRYIRPSRTIRGAVVPEIEFLPRTMRVGSLPACVTCPTVRPGTVPLKDDITFALGDCFCACRLALTTAPVTSWRLLVP